MTTMTKLSNRIHRVAIYAAWMSSACAVTMAAMIWLFNSGWFILWSSRTTGQDLIPTVLDSFGCQVILILSFVIIVSALCGGFRTKG